MIESEFEYIDKIYNNDFVDIIDKIPDEVFDLLILDFPYNLRKDFPNDNLTPREFRKLLRYWVKLIVPKLASNGSLYAFMGYEFIDYLKLLLSKFLIFKNKLIWNYPVSINRKRRNFQSEFDEILFFSKSENYTFNEIRRKPSNYTIQRYRGICNSDGIVDWEKLVPSLKKRYKTKDNYENLGGWNIYKGQPIGNVLIIPKAYNKEKTIHPTQKPEALIETLIKVSSNPDDLVADLFLGSGTTAVCSKRHKRHYFGTEILKKYYDIANNRINNTKILKEYRLKAKIEVKEYRQTTLNI